MLRINKSLNVEQDNLNECIDILEKDLEFALTDFQQLIQSLKNGDRVAAVKQKLGKVTTLEYEANQRRVNESIQKLEKLEKSILDSSINLGKMRSGTLQNPSMSSARNLESVQPKPDLPTTKKVKEEAEKVKKMQQELDSRKKLNKILIKEIEKLKEGEDQAPKEESNKKQRNLENTMQIKATVSERVQSRLNMSQLNTNQEKDKYLMLKEHDLILEKNSNQPNFEELPKFFETQLKSPIYEKEPTIHNETMHQKNVKEIEDIHIKISNIKKRLEIHESILKQTRNCIYKLHNGETLIDLLPEFNPQILADHTQKSLSEVSISELRVFLEQIREQIEFFDGNSDGKVTNFKIGQNEAEQRNAYAPVQPQSQAKLKKLQEEVQNQSQTIQSLVDRIEESKNRQYNLKSLQNTCTEKVSKSEALKLELERMKEKIAAARIQRNQLQEIQKIDIPLKENSEEIKVEVVENSDIEQQSIAGEEETEGAMILTQVDIAAREKPVSTTVHEQEEQAISQEFEHRSLSEEGEKSSSKSIQTQKKIHNPSLAEKKAPLQPEPLLLQSQSPEKKEINVDKNDTQEGLIRDKILEDFVESIEDDVEPKNEAETSIHEIVQDEIRDSKIFTPRGSNAKELLVSPAQIQQAQKELDEYLCLAESIESLPLTSPKLAEEKRPTVSQLLHGKKEDLQSKAESVALDEINDLINF